MINYKISDLRVLLCLAIIMGLFSCSSEQTIKKQVLKHVVAFKFKEGVSEEEKAHAIKIFQDLTDEIPEIKAFEGGKNVSSGGLDKGFTHCFVLTFESEEARDIYLPHPAHMRVVEENKPLFDDLLVMDYWGEK